MKKYTVILLVVILGMTSKIYAASEYQSPFIEDLPELTVSQEDNAMLEWNREGYDASSYSKLLITQPYIYFSEDNKYRGLQPDQEKYLADSIARIFINRLGEIIEIVDEPGPGVLVANIALTNLTMKKKRGIFGYLPAGAVLHAATSQKKYKDLETLAKKILMTDANLEIETLDGETEERLSIRVLKIEGKEKGREEDSWLALSKELNDLGRRFFDNYANSLSMAEIRATAKAKMETGTQGK